MGGERDLPGVRGSAPDHRRNFGRWALDSETHYSGGSPV
jgi:hypothetical protein